MTMLLSTLAVAFAAFCVWLGVRVVNRRERWAKSTAAAVVVLLPVTYGAAYLCMMTPKHCILYSGGPQWTEPRYPGDADERRLQKFFRIANWIDRQIRPEFWYSGPHELEPWLR